MIRNNFTSASIEFWRKHEAEKRAIQSSNLKKGLFMVVVFPIVFLILTFIFANKAHATAAGTMPGGYIGRVLNNTPATWQTYNPVTSSCFSSCH